MTKRAWVAVLLLASCGSHQDVLQALQEHKELWAAKGPASSRSLFTSAGCLPHVQVQVTVVDHAVSGAGGQTMEQLFSDVERRLHSACSVNVSYDETLGYPLAVYSDCGQEGDGWNVSDFSPQ